MPAPGEGEMASTCASCGMQFRNKMQLGAHWPSCVRKHAVDNYSSEDESGDVPVITTPVMDTEEPLPLLAIVRREPGKWGRSTTISNSGRPAWQSNHIFVRNYQQARMCICAQCSVHNLPVYVSCYHERYDTNT